MKITSEDHKNSRELDYNFKKTDLMSRVIN